MQLLHKLDGMLMETSRLIPITIPLASTIYFLVEYDTRALYIIFIAIVNSIINRLAKFILRAVYKHKKVSNLPIIGRGDRPPNASNCSVIYSTKKSTSFGMPSGHSQFIWAIISYLLMYMYYKNYGDTNFEVMYTMSALCLITLGFYVSISRVRMGCHTNQQVIIGGIVGLFIGIGAYYLEPYLHLVDLND